MHRCGLCGDLTGDSWSDSKNRLYYQCGSCGLIQRDPGQILPREQEKARYLLHENSADNTGYVRYLEKIMQRSILPFVKKGDRILDFGCGPRPVLSSLLAEKGLRPFPFDPYFAPDPSWQADLFDAAAAVEVVEHIHDLHEAISTIACSLKKEGHLIVRTMLFSGSREDFSSWWYREDSTHISFLGRNSIDFICGEFNLKLLQLEDNCEIVLRKL